MKAEYYAFEVFNNRRVMLFVPHQDDEICVAGSILGVIANCADDVLVVYMTDGNYVFPSRVRRKEAVRALGTYGIKKEKIVFLGHQDNPNWEHSNIHQNDDYIKECESVREELIQHIKAYRPDIIISNDCDNHPDHQTASFVLDCALKQLTENGGNYDILVLKTFAYDTSFYGPDDYTPYNLKSHIANNGELLDNPKRIWNERLRMPVPANARTKRLRDNIVFKAMRKHVSQYGVKYASRIANADQIYWADEYRTEGSESLNDLWFAKIVYDDEYVYELYTDEKEPSLGVIAFNRSGKRINNNLLGVRLCMTKKKMNRIVRAEVNYGSQVVYDEIVVYPVNNIKLTLYKIINGIDLRFLGVIDRIKYKQIKIMNGVK